MEHSAHEKKVGLSTAGVQLHFQTPIQNKARKDREDGFLNYFLCLSISLCVFM